nr:PREDICTED: uncharacterized protein LOC102367502 isoform X1 [Latimeria chalumnae]|eukprot:XP_005997320.1 PREDICTED: uncharacterized protein LOC102367502 isoform X1 [Latimeria chalumnae]
MMFGWYRTFTLGAPPKSGKKETPSECKVVLTKMKLIRNDYQSKVTSPEDSAPIGSVAEYMLPEIDIPLDSQEDQSISKDHQMNSNLLTGFCEMETVNSNCRLRRLYKFESEDSGVELPSGANSPSTPTGSEKSFVLYRRDSSCDSGMLSTSPSSSPVMDHITLLKSCPEMEGAHTQSCKDQSAKNHGTERAQAILESDDILTFSACEEIRPPSMCFSQNQEDISKNTDKEEDISTAEIPQAVSMDDSEPFTNDFKEPFVDMHKARLHEQPLKKYSTSDSLDEYMDECCRLSEVNQGNVKALGSGLGYLEHICQLIEKIGQLQEHNLRLQKQICGLQEEMKVKQTKEEYFLQYCSCGAASFLHKPYQEDQKVCSLKNGPHSAAVFPGNLSGLSAIPERRKKPEQTKDKGADKQTELGNGAAVAVFRKTSSCKNCEKNVVRHVCERADGQTAHHQGQPMRRVENPGWGRVRDLVKKTKFRNQNKLGSSSGAWKQSCPQLYRPDIASSDLRKKDRRSMIALGINVKNEHVWSH